MSLKRKKNTLFGRVLGFSLVSVVSAIIAIIVAPVSTFLFDQEQLGVINFYFAGVTVFYTLFCLGLDQAYVRFYSIIDCRDRAGLLSFNLLVCLFAVLIVSIIVSFNYDTISLIFFGSKNSSIVIYIACTLAGMLVLRFVSLSFRMEESVAGYTICAGLLALIQKGAYLLAAPITREAEGAIGIVAFGAIFMAVIVLAVCFRHFGQIRFSLRVRLYFRECKYGFPLIFAAASNALVSYVPQLTVRALVGFTGVSVVAAAVTVALSINLIQSGFNAFWAPYVYSHYDSDKKKIQEMHEAVVMVSTFACAVLSILSDPIFLLFQHDYFCASTMVPFFALVPLCYTIGETSGVGLGLELRSGQILAINASVLLCCGGLAMLLIPLYGVSGAAIASGLSALLGLALKTVRGKRYYKSIKSPAMMLKGLGVYLLICIVSLSFPQMSLGKVLAQLVLLGLMVALFGRRRTTWLLCKIRSFLEA